MVFFGESPRVSEGGTFSLRKSHLLTRGLVPRVNFPSRSLVLNSMKLEHILDDLCVAATRRWWMQMFAAFTRCLLALGFIPPSIPKILHKPFTSLPDSHPVGHYFNALMGTGFYYEFIGWSQIIAAILLLIPRTSHIGALMFLPIIVNIAVLTNAVGFAGTWLLTIFMSLAGLFLVAWEYDRLKPIIFSTREEKPRRFGWQFVKIPLFCGIGGAAMGILWWLIGLGNFSNYLVITAMLVGVGTVFGLVVATHYRFMPVGKLNK
ncbi:MAG: hypothetical protein QM785_15580 [Pyrinomonadaceae bacterium]